MGDPFDVSGKSKRPRKSRLYAATRLPHHRPMGSSNRTGKEQPTAKGSIEPYLTALQRITACGNDGKYLDLSGLGLNDIPPEIKRLTAITSLHLERNKLGILPPEIGQLAALTSLHLNGN